MARPLLKAGFKTLWLLMAVAGLQAAMGSSQAAVNTQRVQGERLRLVRADLLENVRVDGDEVQILSGRVVFRKGDMVMTTELARFFKSEGKTIFEKGVVMVRPGERLTCDNIVFHDDRNLIEAWGSVRLEQGNQIINSRELLYFTALDSAVATGEVVMVQDDRRLRADEFRSVQGDGPRGASFWARGNVRMDESQRKVTAESMAYTDAGQQLELAGDTSVEQDNQRLKGERLTLYYEGDTLRSAVVEKEAEATSVINALMTPGGTDWRTFTDILAGRRMEADFHEGSLTTLRIEGMATSIFHLMEDSVLQGINIASGDTMTLGFDTTGYLNRLQVRGGGRGRFEPERANSEVDTVVLYKAAFIDYDIPEGVTLLDRDARVDYRGNGLEAGSIVVTWHDNLMRAKPLYGVRPTLYQAGQDPMSGELMEFDLVAEKGRVVQGRTRLDAGYYQGALIHRHPDNVYYVENSIYTTCSLERPHFYFASKKMKMLQGDKVIARPIILYIMDVPILGLPFAVFPNQPGRRRSGWIMPSYGDNRFSGQHLQGLGYFWAINDYVDVKSLVDFYSKQGIRSTSRLRYTRRGKFSGRVGLRLYRELVGTNDIAHLFTLGKSKMPWSGSWNHSQNFDPTQRLSISGTYTSDPRLNRRFGTTLQDRLNQQIVSNASYSKQWRQSSSSLTLALQDRYDLQAADNVKTVVPTVEGQRIVERTQVLPRLRFSRSNRTIAGDSHKWYSGISMQFSSMLNNSQTIFWEAVVDSAHNDSLIWTTDRQTQRRAQAKHSLSISNSGKLFRYIGVSVGLSLQEDWAPSHFEALVDKDGFFVKDENNKNIPNEVQEFSPRHTGSVRVSAQTNIYGLFPVNIGGLQAIRHTIKPSVSFSYAPDFSKPVLGVDLGYFQYDDKDEKFDRFAGSTIGGTSRTEQRALSISLKNIFQGKREIDGKEDKFMILDWTMSSGYNFAAKKFKIAPVRSSFRSPFLQKLKLDIRMVHDFYALDTVGRKIDKLLPFPRLAQMSATTSIKLSGKHLVPQSEGATVALDADSLALADTLLEQGTEYGETASRSQQVAPTLKAGNLWEANFGIRYRLQPALAEEVAQSFQLSSSIKLAVGGGWSIGYNARFDMLDQELVTHNVRLYRKIHCWEMRFNWTPRGPGKGYYLSINVIDSDLKDIKYESRGGRQSFFGRN
ncbi:MAG: hypothetical protein IIA59_03405 [Candidatus Marinimicrobia bacterium]|nr:hypothetical protein [Candidatus Neomarinimicrobiota bacterium]